MQFPKNAILCVAVSAGTLLPIHSLKAGAESLETASGSAVPNGWLTRHSGSDLVLTPPDVPNGKVFVVTVKPASSLQDDSFQDWFVRQMEAESGRIGTMIQDGEVTSKNDGDILFCVRVFRNAAKENRIGAFAAVRMPGGRARFARIISSPDRDVYSPYIHDGVAAILAMAKSSEDDPDHSKTAHTHSTPPPTQPRTPEPSLQYTTSPGQGVKPSQIYGIYLRMGTGFGVGGYVSVTYEPVLVLKDGTYYEDLDVPPADFNVEAARRLRPKAWGRWRRSGENFETLSPTKGWGKSGWSGPYPGAAPGETLSGSFSHLGGGGDVAYRGGTMIALTNSVTFMPDGHFSGGSSAGVSGNYETGSVSAGSSRNYAGTYRLNGYTAEFHYNDGKVERRSFVFMDKTKKDALYLNGTPYLQDHD